ncbi:MAG: sulfotransferase domain-containing protein [Pseudomonadota bacterium]
MGNTDTEAQDRLTGIGPNFIGIGVQKCATSWLHEILHAHRDIFTSEPKEIDFFTANYDRGYEWYRRHFADAAGTVARGETSPSYFYNPGVPERIHAFDPNIRLLVIFRDPVERAYSNHLHEVRANHITSSEHFEDGLLNNPCYIDQGRYATHLTRWLDTFPTEAILPLIFEEIVSEPESSVRTVYNFLGVDPAGKFDNSRKSSNQSVAYRRPGLQKVMQKGGNALRRSGFGHGLERIKSFPPIKKIMDLNRQNLRHTVPALLPETRKRLEAEFTPEIDALAKMLGRKSLPWSRNS